MPTDVIMPKLGLTMETGTVQRWLAAEGQLVEAGAALLEVETDKLVVEVESPSSGALGALIVREGENVLIGTVLARIYAPGEQQAVTAAGKHPGPAEAQAPLAQAPLPRATPTARRSAPQVARMPEDPRGGSPAERILPRGDQGPAQPERVFSSPRARKRAREAGLDWRVVRGSGPLGRVIERDVLRAALRAAAEEESRTIDHGSLTMDRDRTSIVHGGSPAGEVAWESPTLIQRVAAGRMAASFSTAPHFYLSTEARADALLELRERLLPAVERGAGVRLTITDPLIKIAAMALAEHPRANAFWDAAEGGRIGLHRQIHIGVAVATDAGLVVPVLRNANRLGLAQIAAERERLVQKAQDGKLSPGDLEGSTFTLTNLGMYRVDVFQAILNPPQSAILAVGRIVERPVAIEGQTRVCPTMMVTLSCDHRVLDGVLGAHFLGHVVELIEDPTELMA